jgi:hypothetical protein
VEASVRRAVARHAVAARRWQALGAIGDALLEGRRYGLLGGGFGEESVGEALLSGQSLCRVVPEQIFYALDERSWYGISKVPGQRHGVGLKMGGLDTYKQEQKDILGETGSPAICQGRVPASTVRLLASCRSRQSHRHR